MGLFGTLGSLAGLIPGIGTAIGTGLNVVDTLTSKKKSTNAPWYETAIGAAGEVIGGIAGKDKGYSPEEQEAAKYKYGKKEAEDRIARADAAGLKPQTPRHEYWQGLSQIAPFMQNAIMGSFSDIFGQDTLSKWGASYSPTGAGGQAPPGVPPGMPPIAPPGGGGGMPGGGKYPSEPGGGGRPMPPWMEPGRGQGGGAGRMF